VYVQASGGLGNQLFSGHPSPSMLPCSNRAIEKKVEQEYAMSIRRDAGEQ
jgi:hypothetical protein